MRNALRNSLIALLAVAPAVHAGMLYKCSSAKGAVTIQSDPCPTGSTEIWKRDSAPAPQPSLQQVVADSVRQAPPAAGARAAPSAKPLPPLPPGPPPPGAMNPPPAAAPPPAAFMPPPNAPTTTPLQWHDVPETPAGQPAPDNACDSAKIFANQVQEKVWLGLTRDQTQRLYGWVMDQCERH